MNAPKHLFLFDNGNLACTDSDGNQIPELQRSVVELWANYAVSLGADPEGVVLETASGQFVIFKTASSRWNWGRKHEPESKNT